MKTVRSSSLLLMLALAASTTHAASWQYFRLGNQDDVQTQPIGGTAMMGGGTDLDEAFLWLCGKGNGGDFLVLRASGDDDYNVLQRLYQQIVQAEFGGHLDSARSRCGGRS